MVEKTLSVFFPMFNESKNIERTLTEAARVLPTLGLDAWELVIVDDGSTDNSRELVEARINDIRPPGKLRIVSHETNQGYGSALRTGFGTAVHDLVFYTDSDLPVNLSDLARALPLLDQADVVIGYRTGRRESLRRDVYSFAYRALNRLFFGVSARDINFSFKLMRRSVLAGIDLTSRSVFVDGELLAEIHKRGYAVAELPVDYLRRVHGSSSFDSPRAAIATFVEMIRYRIARR